MQKIPELEDLVLYPCTSSVLMKKEEMRAGVNLHEMLCIKEEKGSK